MRRRQQFSVSATPSDWAAISERAREAGMTISSFIVACALQDEDDMRLALSEEEQRDLLNRVNRILLTLDDLMAPLPGTDVTAREAMAFLVSEAQQRTRRGAAQPAPPDLFDR
ncbi:MAG: hypothetical protein OXI95_05240 [bacterium]|nr:hypothetical protein [bacterium]